MMCCLKDKLQGVIVQNDDMRTLLIGYDDCYSESQMHISVKLVSIRYGKGIQ